MSHIEVDVGGGEHISCYRADPSGEPRGVVVLIHEIWGLVPHIVDVANRLAAEGYTAFAPDLLSSVGISASVGVELQSIMFSEDETVRTEGQPRLREALAPLNVPEYAEWAIRALRSVVDVADAESRDNAGIAVLGFCFGGSYAFALAAADARIRLAIPFYGQPPETAQLEQTGCPMLAFYGDQDAGLMAGLPEVEAAMRMAGVDFTSVVYEGERHAFFNDTNPMTYSAEAAKDAWRRSLIALASWTTDTMGR